MIFRTGSVLIVGKSSDKELFKVYEMLKQILINNYEDICENDDIPIIDHQSVIKVVKIKKRIIYM
jgi:hypothetical protein